KKIFAPWIADFGRASAMRVSALQIGRFRDPPRLIGFALHRGEGAPPEAAGGYRILAQAMQDATGGSENVPIQVTRLKVEKDRYSCEAFEMLWQQMDDYDPSERPVYIDGNRLNVNVRDAYDHLY